MLWVWTISTIEADCRGDFELHWVLLSTNSCSGFAFHHFIECHRKPLVPPSLSSFHRIPIENHSSHRRCHHFIEFHRKPLVPPSLSSFHRIPSKTTRPTVVVIISSNSIENHSSHRRCHHFIEFHRKPLLPPSFAVLRHIGTVSSQNPPATHTQP